MQGEVNHRLTALGNMEQEMEGAERALSEACLRDARIGRLTTILGVNMPVRPAWGLSPLCRTRDPARDG